MRAVIIIVLALAVVSGFLFWRFAPNYTNKKPVIKKDAALTIWGLWEDESLIKPALDEYKQSLPAGKKININYVYQFAPNYRTRIQTQINENQGPDIFLIHNTWLPMFTKNNQLAAMPNQIMDINEYNRIFYPVVGKSLIKDNQIFAIPRGIDGLAMYVNLDILKAANVFVPQSWEQFIQAAIKTTVKDKDGNIETAGAALGATKNVDYWPDIIGLLFMQQPGSKIDSPATSGGADIIKFYTNFVTDPSKKIWDTTLDSSTKMFTEGKLAFYFAPSSEADSLHQTNSNLHFKIVPVPQLPDKTAAWASFWAYAVSAKSANTTEAWEFLKFFTSADTQKLLYKEASKVRLFGLPYSRVELQKDLADDPLVGAFVNQGPIYKSWFLASNTQDQGVNDHMIKYYEDAINAILQGQPSQSVLETLNLGIKQVLTDEVLPKQPAVKKK